MAWDAMTGVTKQHGMFFQGGKSLWDVLSRMVHVLVGEIIDHCNNDIVHLL